MRVRLQLPESNRRRARRAGGALLSVILHLALVAGAVYGTRQVEAAASEPPRRTPTPVFVEVREPVARPAAPGAPAAPVRAPTAPRPAMPAAPRDIPELGDVRVDVPPVTLGAGSGDVSAQDFIAGPIGTIGPVGVGDAPVVGGVLSMHQVERAAALLPGSVPPRYPELLRAGGVEGSVTARFVVDTLGRAEPGSIEILAASHPQFAEAVRRALPRLRFRPAEAGGQRVRQLVEQAFAFALRE